MYHSAQMLDVKHKNYEEIKLYYSFCKTSTAVNYVSFIPSREADAKFGAGKQGWHELQIELIDGLTL